MEENARICSVCGCELERNEGYKVDGDLYCEDCARQCLDWCGECCEYVAEGSTEPIRTRSGLISVCHDCIEDSNYYYQCDDCEEYHDGRWEGRYETHNGNTICNSCYDNYYSTCEECGEVYLTDDMERDDNNDYICSNCVGKIAIKNYSYKPEPKVKTCYHDDYVYPDDVDELLFGIENEIDDGDDQYKTASEIAEQSEDIYIKRDGSLNYTGMEIVTHPCTLDYHIKKLGWENICQTAKKHGYKSHDARTCGLHVHVGTRQLGRTYEERRETVAKIIVLVDRHWDFLVKFSRRRDSQLSRWAARPDLQLKSKKYNESEITELALGTEGRGRYMAVNITNSSTIEFRLFNGTLLPSTIFATLQLVSNICEYAMNVNMAQVLVSTWESIVDYQPYHELQLYIKGRGLMEHENPKEVLLRGEWEERVERKLKEGDIVKIISTKGQVARLSNGLGVIGRVIERLGSSSLKVEVSEIFSPYVGADRTLSINESNLELVMAGA